MVKAEIDAAGLVFWRERLEKLAFGQVTRRLTNVRNRVIILSHIGQDELQLEIMSAGHLGTALKRIGQGEGGAIGAQHLINGGGGAAAFIAFFNGEIIGIKYQAIVG